MTSLSEKTLATLGEETASSAISPAGGTGIAVAGAMGAALCEMTCQHRDLENCDRFATKRRQLLELAERDAEVVDDLFGSDAVGSPADDPRLVQVPESIAKVCVEVLVSGRALLTSDGELVSVDAGCGLWITYGAASAAMAVMRANLEFVHDNARRRELVEAIDDMEDDLADAHEALGTFNRGLGATD